MASSRDSDLIEDPLVEEVLMEEEDPLKELGSMEGDALGQDPLEEDVLIEENYSSEEDDPYGPPKYDPSREATEVCKSLI
jgi:hypothetical protein